MRVLDGRLGPGPIVSCALATAAVGTLAFDLVVDARPTVVAPLVLVLLLLGLTYKVLLPWQGLLTAVVAVILFIPVKRYSLLPSALPFSLEPYRVLIALVAAAWLTSLLVDPRVRLRRSGLEPPMILFGIAALASVGVNGGRIAELGVSSAVVKTLTFWLSFFLLFYVVVSVVRSRSELDALIRALVFCGTVVAAFAMVESRTGFNVFNYLGRLTPALHFNDPAVTAGLTATYLDRSGLRRVYSSAAHPIELAAILTMLAPLALYLLKSTKRKRWLVAFVLLAMGSLTTLSRTGVIMLVVIALVFLWLRPEQTRRLWPALVPAICVIYFVLPNTLGSIYSAFFPKQGLVAQQTQRAALGDGEAADGRLARVGPSIAEWSKRPLLGEGFGSRVTAVNEAIVPRGVTLSNILDDQWLGSLLETGIIGVVALLWLFTRSIRRMTRIARGGRRMARGRARLLRLLLRHLHAHVRRARLRAGHDPALPAPRAHERIRPPPEGVQTAVRRLGRRRDAAALEAAELVDDIRSAPRADRDINGDGDSRADQQARQRADTGVHQQLADKQYADSDRDGRLEHAPDRASEVTDSDSERPRGYPEVQRLHERAGDGETGGHADDPPGESDHERDEAGRKRDERVQE
jgi:hypothetical protein